MTTQMPATEVFEARTFLNTVFGTKELTEHVLIWLSANKRSVWFRDIEDAVGYVQRHAGQDVYVGVALSPADHGPHQRLKVEENERPPSSIIGFWADIDIVDGVHKKANLPSTETEALG